MPNNSESDMIGEGGAEAAPKYVEERPWCDRPSSKRSLVHNPADIKQRPAIAHFDRKSSQFRRACENFNSVASIRKSARIGRQR